MTEYTRPATWNDVLRLAAAELADDTDVFADDERYAIRINDELTVDVLPSIAGLSRQDMLPHIVTMTVDDVEIRVLDLPGLLKTKQGIRPPHRRDRLQ